MKWYKVLPCLWLLSTVGCGDSAALGESTEPMVSTGVRPSAPNGQASTSDHAGALGAGVLAASEPPGDLAFDPQFDVYSSYNEKLNIPQPLMPNHGAVAGRGFLRNVQRVP